MAEENESEDIVLTDEDNEPAMTFPTGGLEGMFAADGSTKLSWDDLKATAKRVVYVFDSVSGMRYYLKAQVIDGYLKITTEMS